MKNTFLVFGFAFIFYSSTHSQDTFSIVAVDSITGEVGSAGASCVDLTNFAGLTDHFLGELFPGLGAINSQAYYIPANQANARARMNAGDTPSEIIDWLINNDVQNLPQLRQYGIVAMVDGNPVSAAHTGTSTDDYKNHITGPNYAIQGNILLGQAVLDSMESRFLSAEGDLACKLMAAMQGANVVGADTRCFSNGSSSLFAFVKVAQPDDAFGDPSFVLSVRTADGDEIEPIDSLQTLFDEVKNCDVLDNVEYSPLDNKILVYPNPFKDFIEVSSKAIGQFDVEILDISGKAVAKQKMADRIHIKTVDLRAGYYVLRVSDGQQTFLQKLIKH